MLPLRILLGAALTASVTACMADATTGSLPTRSNKGAGEQDDRDDAPGASPSAPGQGSPGAGARDAAAGNPGSPQDPPPVGGSDAGATGDGGALAGPSTILEVGAGPTTFDLGLANADLRGAKLLAIGQILVDAAGKQNGLTLLNIEVQAPAGTGMRLYRPVFIVNVGGVDTANVFRPNPPVDQSIPAGRTVRFAASSMTVSGYPPGAKLKIAFGAALPSTVTAVTGLPGYTDCTATNVFTAQAAPQLRQSTCRNCHAGRFAGFDILARDVATACGEFRPQIQDLLRPSRAGHAGGGVSAAYTNALNAWRTAEGL